MNPHVLSAGAVYATAFGLAGLVSLLGTPLIVQLANRLGIVDATGDERRMHDSPKPRVGGIAVFFGFAFALFAVLGVAMASPFRLLPPGDQFDAVHKLVGLLFGSLLIVGVGIWDDVMQMRPRNKLIAQVVVASISMLYGFVIPGINNPFDRNPGTNWIDFPLWVGVPLTLLWYVGMMNAINFLDGLDGLLAGVAAISSIFLFIIAVLHANPVVALVVIALAGAALGFLPYNFQSGPHHPRRCGIALHRLRLRYGLDHRRQQDGDCDQHRRSAARACPSGARHRGGDRAAGDQRQADHRSRPGAFSPPADLSLRSQRAPSRAALVRGMLRPRSGGARILGRVHARL